MANNLYFLSWKEIYEEILSYLPPSWRLTTGKILTRLLVAYALALESMYALLARLLRLSIVATSEGEWLRSLVSAFNMETLASTKAIAPIEFTRYSSNSSQTVVIPAGRRLLSRGGVLFETIGTAVIQAGATKASVPARAVLAGSAGNVGAGEINGLQVAIAGVDRVTNTAPAEGGSELETDAQIKRRLPGHIDALHRATIPATEYVIRELRDQFPEVQSFITQRNYGYPGYFRGILCPFSGVDRYKPSEWTSFGGGIWWCRTDIDEINGVVAADWICKRFGVVRRSPDGEETWNSSGSVAELSGGEWRFCHDKNARKLYLRADGRDVNAMDITIVADVFWRAQRALETDWAANGVYLDVIAPFVTWTPVSLTYELEPNYNQITVENALRNACFAHINNLWMGTTLQLENLYTVLNGVAGAFGVIVRSPASNVVPDADHIVRVQGSINVERRS